MEWSSGEAYQPFRNEGLHDPRRMVILAMMTYKVHTQTFPRRANFRVTHTERIMQYVVDQDRPTTSWLAYKPCRDTVLPQLRRHFQLRSGHACCEVPKEVRDGTVSPPPFEPPKCV